MKKNEKFEGISKTRMHENGMPRLEMVPVENNVLFCLDYFTMVFDIHNSLSQLFSFSFCFLYSLIIKAR